MKIENYRKQKSYDGHFNWYGYHIISMIIIYHDNIYYGYVFGEGEVKINIEISTEHLAHHIIMEYFSLVNI